MKCKRKSCKYRSHFSSNLEYCDYITQTGHSRGCDPSDCVKLGIYETKTERRPNYPIVISKDPEQIKAARARKRVMK